MSTDALPDPQPPRRFARSRATIPLLLVGAAGVLLVLFAWRLPPFHSTVQSTDNAYVRGGVTVISPKLDGYVTGVAVQDFDTVETGRLLVQLDDRIPRQRLAQAQANFAAQQAALSNNAQSQASAQANVSVTDAQVASAQAALTRARADAARYETLFQRGYVARQQLDQFRTALAQAQATVAQNQASRLAAREGVTTAVVGRGSLEAAVQNAQAAIQLAQIDVENTRITAPRAGRLGEVGVRLGQYVTPGTQLMAIVPDQVWVVANFKETQMARIRAGQPATMRVDALNGARLKGHVQRIAPAAGSEFAILRPDNATGNFTKVAQRIPVRIALDLNQAAAARLEPGMSVVASIDTAGAAP